MCEVPVEGFLNLLVPADMVRGFNRMPVETVAEGRHSDDQVPLATNFISEMVAQSNLVALFSSSADVNALWHGPYA